MIYVNYECSVERRTTVLLIIDALGLAAANRFTCETLLLPQHPAHALSTLIKSLSSSPWGKLTG